MNALGAPQYDISQYGWDIAASPRHADVVTVTGPMTEAMRNAAHSTVDATAQPRSIVAIGDCAVGTGAWCNVGTAGPGAGIELAAEVHVPGCPPTPDAIIHGLRQAAQLLDLRSRRKR